MSEETEQEIGDEGARQIEMQLGIVEDEALAKYVGELGRKLARLSPRQDVEYSFHIVEMEEPNAFALPGGYIYVSRGLLALANSEAELAGVIAHEIGHVAARHSAQRDTQVKVASLLTLLGMVAAATTGDGKAVAATQYLGQGFIAAYSREQERQSDRIAMELAAGSGIDPAGLASFLRSLDNTTRLREGASRAPGFFDSHPATPERLAEATTRAQVLRWKPDVAAGSDALLSAARARDAFISRLDGLVVGPAAREGVLRDNYLLHADLGFALRFPHGWSVHNARSHVIALSPGRDAIALLEQQGPGDDPRAAAAAHARAEGLFLSDAAPDSHRLPAGLSRALQGADAGRRRGLGDHVDRLPRPHLPSGRGQRARQLPQVRGHLPLLRAGLPAAARRRLRRHRRAAPASRCGAGGRDARRAVRNAPATNGT